MIVVLKGSRTVFYLSCRVHGLFVKIDIKKQVLKILEVIGRPSVVIEIFCIAYKNIVRKNFSLNQFANIIIFCGQLYLLTRDQLTDPTL